MKCANCGAEVRDDARFCAECGRPLTAAKQAAKPARTAPKREKEKPVKEKKEKPVKEKPVKEKKPKKKVKWGLVLFLVILVAVVVLAAYAYFAFPSFKMMRSLNKGTAESYQNAAALYTENVEPSFFQTRLAVLLCKEKLAKPAEDYQADKLSFEDAAAFYNTVGADPDANALSRRAAELLAEIEEKHAIEQNLAAGDAAFAAGDYATAMDYYSRIPQDSDAYRSAQDKIAESHLKYVNDVLDKADAYLKNGAYSDAIQVLDTAVAILPDDETLLQKQSAVAAAYEQVVLDKVAEYIEANQYDAAIAELENAVQVLPDSRTLSAQLDELSDSQPTKLKDVKLLDSGHYEYTQGTYTDAQGESYDGAHVFSTYWSSDESYAIFDVDGKFSIFSGVIVCDENAPTDIKFTVTIYGDDAVLYTSDTNRKSSGAVKFDVDVSGVSKLEIRVDLEGSSTRTAAIVNAILKA